MTAHALLPDILVKPCVEVLGVMSANERDLVRVVVEIIDEIRESFAQPGAGDEMVTSHICFHMYAIPGMLICFHR